MPLTITQEIASVILVIVFNFAEGWVRCVRSTTPSTGTHRTLRIICPGLSLSTIPYRSRNISAVSLNALAITVPAGKYLALSITNNSSSDYGVQVGGSWSYVASPLSISGYVRGDVSGNGTVSAYDAARVLQYVVGLITLTDTQKEAADVSNNGTVSPYDAALILQYVIGLIPSFPEESGVGAPILDVTSESELLAKAIKELEGIHLSDEQQRVAEQLKRLLNQPTIPVYTALLQNYPNPFNPETWIPFKLAQNAPVTINIYDTKGQLIHTIALGNKQAGVYVTKDKSAYWDGRDGLGDKVSSGIHW